MNEKLETIIQEAFDNLGIEYFPPKTAPNGSLLKYTQDYGPSDPEVIQFLQAIKDGEQPAPPAILVRYGTRDPEIIQGAREIEAFFERNKDGEQPPSTSSGGGNAPPGS